jgi:hypothetical protein
MVFPQGPGSRCSIFLMHMAHNGNYRARCRPFLGRRSVPYPEVPQESSTILLNGNLKVRKEQSAERRAQSEKSHKSEYTKRRSTPIICCMVAYDCCLLPAVFPYALCPMPYALCSILNPHSEIRIPKSHLGLAWFLQFEKTTINSD